MKRIILVFFVTGIVNFFITSNALAFIIQETDYEIPNATWIPPVVLPEFAPTGFSFTREYDSDILSDGWVGFGWTWDITGLKGYTSGISSFIEGLSTSTVETLSDGSSWQFDLLTNKIDFSYFDSTSTLTGTFRLEFNSDDSRLERITDYLGNTTTYVYTIAGDLESATTPFGERTQYLYDSDHLLKTRIDYEGNRTDYTVPEPSLLALLALGLVGLAATSRYIKH